MLNRTRDRIADIDFYDMLGKIVAPLMIAIIVIWCAFSVVKGAKSENEYIINDANTMIFVDGETGVNYIIYKGVRETSITVRYNADGTVYVSEKESEESKK